jgi:hypothetical protein
MKSIKNQYIDLQEGKMSQAQFLRNVRLNMPQYVTNVTSFGDTIKILRNKGILSEADIKYKDGKDMYAQFKEIDNLNAQEVLIGIDYEMEKNQDLSKEAATKIVIKNLKKNQFYYTAEDMSGKEGYEMEYIGGKSANADARHMKPVEKDNLVDKVMGMKPVKGFENAKASSNKASKETNKGKDVELMSLIAKTVRGLVKMDATGEKVKKIIVKEVTDAQQKYIDKSAHLPSKKLSYQMSPFDKEVAAAKRMIIGGADEEKLRNKFSFAAISAANAELIDDDYMNESLNEGPLGTQLLRKADAALKAGQTVTVLGKPIMKIVVPAGALFPADGGPSFRLNNLKNPLEDILVDGNEIKLDLPAPQAPRVDTRTPDQIAADQAAFNDRYGPGGGYDTPMGRRTFDEAMNNDPKYDDDDNLPAYLRMYNSDAYVQAMQDAGEEEYTSPNRDQDREDYEPDTDADYEEPNDDFDMAEGKMEEGERNKYHDLIAKLKEKGISRDHMNQGKYINDVAKVMTAVGYSDREIINSIINDQDFLPDLMQATKSVKIDTGDFDDHDTDDEDQYTDSSSSKYYDDDYNNMEEGMGDMLSQAQQFIDSNPTLRQHAEDIVLFNDKNGVGLKYLDKKALPDELYTKLELQFNVNGIDDFTDEEGEVIYYTLTPKHSPLETGVGLQSPMEEMIRKIVREMFDGMEPMDRTGMDA